MNELMQTIELLDKNLNNSEYNWINDEERENQQQIQDWLLNLWQLLYGGILESALFDLEPFAICKGDRNCDNCPLSKKEDGCKWIFHDIVAEMTGNDIL